MRKNSAPLLRRLSLHFILLTISVIMILPLFWMITTSLKTISETMQVVPVLLPHQPQFGNYFEIFTGTDYIRYFINTLFVTAIKTIGQLLICSLAAFAFATMRFPGRNGLFITILMMMMIPSQISLIPTFMIIKKLGWLDSYQALIVPSLASAFGIFLLRQFFLSIPMEINEAAKIDGASYFQIYSRFYIPLSRAGLVALSIFVIIASWNDFVGPLIMTSSDEMRLLSLAVSSYIGEFSTDYPLMMAATTMSVLPLIIIFLFFQRYFIEGLALSAAKE